MACWPRYAAGADPGASAQRSAPARGLEGSLSTSRSCLNVDPVWPGRDVPRHAADGRHCDGSAQEALTKKQHLSRARRAPSELVTDVWAAAPWSVALELDVARSKVARSVGGAAGSAAALAISSTRPWRAQLCVAMVSPAQMKRAPPDEGCLGVNVMLCRMWAVDHGMTLTGTVALSHPAFSSPQILH